MVTVSISGPDREGAIWSGGYEARRPSRRKWGFQMPRASDPNFRSSRDLRFTSLRRRRRLFSSMNMLAVTLGPTVTPTTRFPESSVSPASLKPRSTVNNGYVGELRVAKDVRG